jgi:hypothetical protein
MRRFACLDRRASLASILLAAAFTPALALEHGSSVPLPPGPAPDGTATCQIWHYDPCAGLVITWPLTESGQTFGVQYQSCAPDAELDGVWLFSVYGTPAGWGYTSTMSVHAVDGPGSPIDPPLSEQPFLSDPGWSYVPLAVPVPDDFLVAVRYDGFNGLFADAPYTDDPYDPCVPFRPPHSYYLGTPDAPIRPGSPLFSDTEGAFELMWQAWLSAPTDIPGDSWSSIKSLYR